MNRIAHKDKQLPSFKKPPLIEVACGISFKALESLKIPHYGLFWNEIREEFPLCQHAPPLGDISTEIITNEFPLPRVWLIAKSKNILLQLQKDRFVFNWRKISSDEEYPRFDNVFIQFKQYLNKFINFLDSNEIGKFEPVRCELTYINHIVKGEGWESLEDINNIMRDIMLSSDKSFLPEPSGLSWNGSYPFQNDEGALTVKLTHAKRKSDLLDLLVLELATKGFRIGDNLDENLSWYDLAHSWIVNGFADITQQEIQTKLWGRE